jgi:hypothetical protein
LTTEPFGCRYWVITSKGKAAIHGETLLLEGFAPDRQRERWEVVFDKAHANEATPPHPAIHWFVRRFCLLSIFGGRYCDLHFGRNAFGRVSSLTLSDCYTRVTRATRRRNASW